MNCYSTTLIAKFYCNIYSFVVKYHRTFCLHAHCFGVSGFHKCFFDISSVRSLSPQAMKDSSHLIYTFIILSSLLLTLVTIPQHHIYLFSSSSLGYEKHISMWYPWSMFWSWYVVIYINKYDLILGFTRNTPILLVKITM